MFTIFTKILFFFVAGLAWNKNSYAARTMLVNIFDESWSVGGATAGGVYVDCYVTNISTYVQDVTIVSNRSTCNTPPCTGTFTPFATTTISLPAYGYSKWRYRNETSASMFPVVIQLSIAQDRGAITGSCVNYKILTNDAARGPIAYMNGGRPF